MKNLLLLFLFCAPLFTIGQPTPATLLGHWSDPSIVPAFFANPYHDVWGIVVDGKEYGVITSTQGFHIFDLSDMANPLEPAAFVPGTAQGGGISHRDVKAYQHYLYGVADEGSSALQVIDVSGLPESAELVYESNEFFTTAHNIFIDEDNARLYVAGSFGGPGSNLKILSLENPEQPTLLASTYLNVFIPYIHDLYVRDNIAYLHAGQFGLIVVDFTDPAAPVLLGTMDNYPQQGYNHSGWLSDDGQYYYLCDETHGSDIKIVDVSDLSEMRVISTMNAGSFQEQIPHNVYPKDGLLYVSYYYDGLQVYDVSNPLFPRRAVYYDTYEGPDDDYFAGAWGVFVMPSGKVLISDMNNGFYVFEAPGTLLNTTASPNISKIQGCQGQTAEFSLWIGPDLSGEVTISTEGTSPGLTVTLSATTAMPGDIVSGSITATAAGEDQMVVFSVTDGVNSGSSVVPAYIVGLPDPPTLFAPADNKTEVALSPLFIWSSGSLHPRRIEVSTQADDFEANIIYTASIPGNSHFLPIDLEGGATYYWRIVTTGECGDNPSAVFSFTTVLVNSISEIGGNSFRLFPNPAAESLWLSFERPLEEALRIDWLLPNGQRVKTESVTTSFTALEQDISTLPAGLYFLRLSTDRHSVTRRIVVQ